MTHHLEAPIVDNLEILDTAFRAKLEDLAIEPRTKRRLSQAAMRQVIVTVCRDQYLTLSVLSDLVNRDQDALRQQHLNAMVKTQILKLAFPSAPTHPQQAYIANVEQE